MAPAAMTQWRPMVTPGRMTALAPIHTSSLMTTGWVLTPCSSMSLLVSLKLWFRAVTVMPCARFT